MKNLKEEITRIKKLILIEQNIKDKVLLDKACKKWNTLSMEDKTKFQNNSTKITKEKLTLAYLDAVVVVVVVVVVGIRVAVVVSV